MTTDIINFLIIAFAVFLLVRQVTKMKEAPSPTTKECPQCLSTIPSRAMRCAYCTSTL